MEENKAVRDRDGYFSLSALVDSFGGRLMVKGCGENGDRRVDEIVIDSRRVGKSSLFVALTGEHEDGERYLADAFRRGAVAVLCRKGGADRINAFGVYIEVEDPLHSLVQAAKKARVDSDFFVVGITGSVGKTTVKELCIQTLSGRYPTDGTDGNYNNLLGLSLSILNAFGVDKMNEIRGKSWENVRKRLVLEMGISHKGEMEGLADIARPDLAIITGVGKMHAEHLGGRAGIASEKAKILLYGAERVICPCDDTVLGQVFTYVGRERVIALSCSENAGLSGVTHAQIKRDLADGGFSLILSDKIGHNTEYGRFTAPIVGEHGIWDSAMAALLGWSTGVSCDEVRCGLSSFRPASMRQEIRTDGEVTRIVDCYNSGPESARAALSALSEYARKNGCARRIAVLGDMLELGVISEKEHFMLGEELFSYGVDLLFTVGERSETIADGAASGGLPEACIVRFGSDTPHEAVKARIESALRAGDVILYKASRGIGLEKVIPENVKRG